MLIRRLHLENFRNIRELDLELAPGRTVLYGGNAQGKTNILEALFVLAAAKSVRARHDRELISWAPEGTIPYTRIEADVERAGSLLNIDLVLQLTPAQAGSAGDPIHLQKRFRVNGTKRKASELVGEVQAVLFEPHDVALVFGPPMVRRRFLDLTLSQIDRELLHSLQDYSRVLAQRNSLLKAIRDRRANTDELTYWDEGLVTAGAVVIGARRDALRRLGEIAAEVYRELTASEELLSLTYTPSPLDALGTAGAHLEEHLLCALTDVREREIAQGTTVVGPHRDDFIFTAHGVNLASFGSRGQQRLATLALKLAEAGFMEERTGEQPILLLDDVLSELDPVRRRYLMKRVEQHPQAIITTADRSAFDQEFLQRSRVIHIAAGTAVPTAPSLDPVVRPD